MATYPSNRAIAANGLGALLKALDGSKVSSDFVFVGRRI